MSWKLIAAAAEPLGSFCNGCESFWRKMALRSAHPRTARLRPKAKRLNEPFSAQSSIVTSKRGTFSELSTVSATPYLCTKERRFPDRSAKPLRRAGAGGSAGGATGTGSLANLNALPSLIRFRQSRPRNMKPAVNSPDLIDGHDDIRLKLKWKANTYEVG